jgi:squalene-hopene/tetraprenyl-beta-curcumene cyclase
MNSLDDSIIRCIRYLESQRKIGYVESIHKMQFPIIFLNPDTYDPHEGLIFQRALICDALLDGRDLGFEINRNGLIEDANILIKSAATDVDGGWRYFPFLNSLPPDADDLGQILQVLLRTGIKIPALVNSALDLVFTQGAYSNGSFETWIVNRKHQSGVNKSIIWAIENMWGKGPDVEVMANLLFAVDMYNSKGYETQVKKGCKFIIESQKPRGYWDNTWYVDKFYSIFVCSRLISRISPNHQCLENTRTFLLHEQRNNGSWGEGGGSPLQTSLALLSLLHLGSPIDTKIQNAMNKGIAYIIESQNVDGSWEATPFIQMNTNRAFNQRNIGRPNMLTYQSETMTSVFCLKALSKYSKMSKDNNYGQ